MLLLLLLLREAMLPTGRPRAPARLRRATSRARPGSGEQPAGHASMLSQRSRALGCRVLLVLVLVLLLLLLLLLLLAAAAESHVRGPRRCPRVQGLQHGPPVQGPGMALTWHRH